MAVQVDYLSDSACVQFVTELVTIDTVIKRRLMEQHLEDCLGIADGSYAAIAADTNVYRPYYTAARQLQRNRDDQFLTEGDGAKFSNLTIMIQSLLEEQLALDNKLGLVVPDGYGAQAAIDLHCGCDKVKACCGKEDSTTVTAATASGLMSILVA